MSKGRRKGASKGRDRRARRALMFKRQRGKCYYCRGPMALKQGKLNSATFEHCKPFSQGGTMSYWNTVLVCHSCNLRRGTGPAPKPHPWDANRGVWRDVLTD